MEYALQLLISLLLGIFAGQWLDAKLHTTPWMTLAGLFIGMILGFGILYKRAIAKIPPPRKKDDKDTPQ